LPCGGHEGYEQVRSPIEIGDVTGPNRTVRPAYATGIGDANTPRFLAREIADGNAAARSL